ncbi:ABC transporter substrate-binding protein [Oceanisphaera sp. IT1-181]|uniref:ABC transporter substrate-binding protein n=1 Tax=Oceanisphaera sp. IT1-181 TaxID=3081199 RepID=UPI0029CA1067|nr:ABC transporter substrate-binding protein [Oceanisphaera sp. IT1-181]
MRLWLWALLPALLIAGCNEKDPQLAQNSLLYCTPSSPSSFNPQLVISTETLDATAHQLYDRLLTLDPLSQQPRPALATDWQRSDDGLRYRFRLQPDVAFHHTPWFSPSRPFNAQDVVFSFTRLADKQHPYHLVSGGRYPFFSAISWAQLVKQVHIVNEHEVEFVLNHANADFLHYLASDYAVILSAEYGAQLLAAGTPQLLDQQPVGTGPFLLNLYRPDEFIRYHRHPNYWQTGDGLQHLVLDITPKSSKRLAKMLSGECDAMANPAASQLEVIQKHPDIALSAAAGSNVAVLALNTQKPPFNDHRVRNAIRLALNKNDILQAVYFGRASLAESLLPATFWQQAILAHPSSFISSDINPAINPTISPATSSPLMPTKSGAGRAQPAPFTDSEREQQLTEAKNLLAQAGLSGGFKMTLLMPAGARAYNPDGLKTGQLLQQQLAPLGIKLTLRALDEQVLRNSLLAGQQDAVLTGWSADIPSPDNILRNLLSCRAIGAGTNASRWCNPAFEVELNLALTEPDQLRRHAYYQAAQYLAELDVALIPLVHSRRHLAYRYSIAGLQLLPYGGINFQLAEKE